MEHTYELTNVIEYATNELDDIRNDIHVDNIGKIDGNVVCIDYGDIKIVGR